MRKIGNLYGKNVADDPIKFKNQITQSLNGLTRKRNQRIKICNKSGIVNLDE